MSNKINYRDPVLIRWAEMNRLTKKKKAYNEAVKLGYNGEYHDKTLIQLIDYIQDYKLNNE